MTTDSVFVSVSVCQKKASVHVCASAGVLGGVQTFFFFFFGSFSGPLASDLSVLLLFFRSSAPELQTSGFLFLADRLPRIRQSAAERRRFVSFRCRLAWGAWLRPASCRFYAFGDVSRTFSATTLFNLKTSTC